MLSTPFLDSWEQHITQKCTYIKYVDLSSKSSWMLKPSFKNWIMYTLWGIKLYMVISVHIYMCLLCVS